MRGFVLCVVFATVLLTAAEGDEEQEEEELAMLLPALECFRCDLGFWDACHTTRTPCNTGERCYTGRGKAAQALDVKTLGCAKAEECGAVSTVTLFPNMTLFQNVTLFPNITVYTVTKTCCETDLCNAAPRPLPLHTLLLLTATTTPTLLLLTAPSLGLQ